MNTTCLLHRYAVDANAWDRNYWTYQDAQRCIRLARKGYRGIHVREPLWFYRVTPNAVWNGGGPRLAQRHADLERLKTEYDWPRKSARLTFVSLISRDLPMLDDYFAAIPKLGLPPDTHWLVIIDTDDHAFADRVIAKSLKHDKHFYSTRHYVTATKNVATSGEFTSRAMHIAALVRVAIAECRNAISETPYIAMLEDDTVPEEPHAFRKLFNVISKSTHIAYVTGVEPSRAATRHLGVCHLTTKDGEIVKRHLPLPKKEGVEPITGGGWYCWIGRAHALKGIEFRACEDRKLGPDVLMVYDLHRAGYETLVRWDVRCKHWHPKANRYLTVDEAKSMDVTYTRARNGGWDMDIEPIEPTK
jgi:hypothetical protein